MIIYILEVWTPYDGSEILGVYSSEAKAHDEHTRYKKEEPAPRHERECITKYEIDAPVDYSERV